MTMWEGTGVLLLANLNHLLVHRSMESYTLGAFVSQPSKLCGSKGLQKQTGDESATLRVEIDCLPNRP